ncbi:MAG: cation:proton antiporter [Candidatus Bathyarchaeota archaeon]|jgi:cell volume regulation protein A
MIDPFQVLLLFSVTLVLSYFSSLIYTKIKIPDLVWLLGIGFLLGPTLGVIQKDIFVAASQVMGIVALNIVTFGAGIETDIDALKEVLTKSATLATMTFIVIVLGIGILVKVYSPFPLSVWEGVLFGTMIAGVSTVSVLSVIDEMKKLMPKMDNTRLILALESTIVDPIRIVVAITIIKMIQFSNLAPLTSIRDIYATFTLATVLGVIFGIIWVILLNRLRGRRYNYMLTISVLFLLYFLMETLTGQGGGAIATFAFGIVLANYQFFAKRLNMNLRVDKSSIIQFNNEISFFVKSYYFVYMGLIATVSREYIVIGIVLTALVIVLRALVGTVVGKLLNFTKRELVISRLMFPLGTSALVVSQIPLIYDPEGIIFKHPEMYTNMLIPVILGTVLFSALISPKIAQRQLEDEESTK